MGEKIANVLINYCGTGTYPYLSTLPTLAISKNVRGTILGAHSMDMPTNVLICMLLVEGP